MAASLTLEQIIRKECVPVLDCMLTVTDESGEAGFLYFKEGEMVEANFSSLWGQDALMEILAFRITSRAITPLPLGIKRSLWDSLDHLLHPGGKVSGKVTTTTSAMSKTRRMPTGSLGSGALTRYKTISNLLKMVEVSRDKETTLFEAPVEKGAEAESTAWLVEFAGRVRAVGDTLGFGGCEKWTIETDKNQIVGLAREDKFIAMVRRRDPMAEDLETLVNNATEAL